MKAIIPFKKEGAKSRLGHFLSKTEREEFALKMLTDVLGALAKSTIQEVEIIAAGSGDALVKDAELNGAVAEKSRVKVAVREDTRDLNEALNDVLPRLKDPVLIVMADVPLITPESINEIIEHEEDVVIVPGRKGGTNALFLRSPYAFVVSYYGNSFEKHLETAKRKNLSYAIYDSFFISTDIDEVEDLLELLIHGTGLAAEYLHTLGVCYHVAKNAKSRATVERR